MAKVKKGHSLVHVFEFFKKQNKIDITEKEFKNICYSFNKKISNKILEGSVVKLPHYLGDLSIKKIQTDWEKPRVDIVETVRLGKTIYHLNEHSDGWWARWFWSKNNNLTTNVIFYSFTPTRRNSRRVAEIMKKEGGHKTFFS